MSIDSAVLDEAPAGLAIADPFGADPGFEIVPSQRAEAIAKEIVREFTPDAPETVLRRRLFRHSIEPDKKKLELWPMAEPQGLSPARQDLFDRRCDAISGYMRGQSLRDLSDSYKISPWQIRRLRNRCLAVHPDGRIWGYPNHKRHRVRKIVIQMRQKSTRHLRH